MTEEPTRRLQEPVPPFPYVEEPVTYENAAAGVTLAGTLTIPEGGGPFPAAILITGSGAHDRDEAVMGHKPFLVVADHLARNGIAVLRTDDRGVGESTGDSGTGSASDFAEDVQAGIGYLETREEIGQGRIGLVGHSDGAGIAVALAGRGAPIAWIAMLAGAGVPGDELLLEQADLVAASMGVPDEARAVSRELSGAIYAVARDQADDAIARQEIHRLIDEHSPALADAQGATVNQVAEQARGQIDALLGPWFRDFVRSDPRPALRRIRVPVLAMNGELDLQVPADLNLSAIEQALEGGECPDYTVIELGGLNHLFQTAITGSPAEYEQIEETFALAALDVLTEWIGRVDPGSPPG